MERNDYQRVLEAEISVVRAQNERLTDENSFLRDKLNRLTSNQRSTAASNVEAKIKAHQLEEERNDMWENFEKLKKKYNQLHQAYCDKVKKCKILENTFQQQKTLPGLVTKSALNHRNEAREKKETFIVVEAEVDRLQKALEESYDVIDALEFELDSVELLEEENQILRNELADLKKKFNEQCRTRIVDTDNTGDHAHDHRESKCDSCVHFSDFDHETLERTVLTNSVFQSVEAETRLNKRELLKHRIQNTNKPSGKQETETKKETSN